MVFRFLRVPAAVACIGLLTCVASAADEIPQINTARPHAMPAYPDAARRAKQTGTTIVAVHVNEIGKPYEVEVATSSGSPVLDKAARDAVHRWFFVPAEKDGTSVAEWTAVGINFGADGVTQIPVSPDTEIARQDRSRIICRNPPSTTGSHLRSEPICQPSWQWDEQDRKASDLHWRVPNMANTGAAGGQ